VSKSVLDVIDEARASIAGLGLPDTVGALVEVRAKVSALINAAEKANAMYSHVWDRADGALTVFPESVQRFDDTFAALHEKLAAAKGETT